MNFFSLDPEGYTIYRTLFKKYTQCRKCDGWMHNKGTYSNWVKVIGLVESGRSLASILDAASSEPSNEEVEGLIWPMEMCERCSLDPKWMGESSDTDSSDEHSSDGMFDDDRSSEWAD